MIRSLRYLLLRRVLGLFRSDARMAAQAELEIALRDAQASTPRFES